MVRRLCEISFHFVPAFVLDIVFRLIGSKSMQVRTETKTQNTEPAATMVHVFDCPPYTHTQNCRRGLSPVLPSIFFRASNSTTVRDYYYVSPNDGTVVVGTVTAVGNETSRKFSLNGDVFVGRKRTFRAGRDTFGVHLAIIVSERRGRYARLL